VVPRPLSGIDIIEIDRIKSAIERYQDGFINRIYTPNEIAYCEKFFCKYEKYAARFAVKEAVAKVIKSGPRAFFLEMEIQIDTNGAPFLILSDTLKKIFPYEIEISMSHCKAYAVGMATAILA